MREHLQLSADRGSRASQEALEGPEFPEPLAYLHRWLFELHGRSGIGMHGAAPLTYTTIRDWMALKDVAPTPLEIDALMLLDQTLLSARAEAHRRETAPAPTTSATGPVRVRAAGTSWPVKKG